MCPWDTHHVYRKQSRGRCLKWEQWQQNPHELLTCCWEHLQGTDKAAQVPGSSAQHLAMRHQTRGTCLQPSGLQNTQTCPLKAAAFCEAASLQGMLGWETHPSTQIQAPHSVSWAVHRLSPAGTWLLCHVAQKHLHSPLAAGWCKTHQGLGFLLHSLQSYLDLEQMKALSVSKSSKYLMISALRPLAPCIAPIFAFPCPRSRAEITSCTISSPARSKSQGRVWVIFPGEYFSHTSLFVFRQTRTIMQHKFF